MSKPSAPILTFDFSSSLLPAGKVFQFSGNTSVTNDSVTNFPVNGLTLSFWLKTSSSENEILFSYDADTPDKRLWVSNPADLKVGFGSNSTGSTGIAVNDNYWHHVAINVFPVGSLHYGVEIFRDGVSVYMGQGAIARPVNNTLETYGALALGKGVGSEKGFNGFMSEFRLWDSVRTADQIMTSMQSRVTSSTPGIVIVWALKSNASSGTVSNGSFVTSSLRFRTFRMEASWTPVTNAAYNLEINEKSDCWNFIRNNISGTTQAVTGYALNKTYIGKVQAIVGGEASDLEQYRPNRCSGPAAAATQLAPASGQPTGSLLAEGRSGPELQCDHTACGRKSKYC